MTAIFFQQSDSLQVNISFGLDYQYLQNILVSDICETSEEKSHAETDAIIKQASLIVLQCAGKMQKRKSVLTVRFMKPKNFLSIKIMLSKFPSGRLSRTDSTRS